MDYSPTTIQVCIALAMLIMLVGALWPKLVCKTSMADENLRTRPIGMAARRATFHKVSSAHALRVRESYGRMFGRWIHVPASAPKSIAQNEKAA